MPSLGMKGPYELTPQKIDTVIVGVFAGNYAIGYTKESGAFVVRYVGRATDLNRELKTLPCDSSTKFKWSYAPSEKVAFDKECKTYHDFGGSEKLENEYHPARPDDTNWKCPVCDIYD